MLDPEALRVLVACDAASRQYYPTMGDVRDYPIAYKAVWMELAMQIVKTALWAV